MSQFEDYMSKLMADAAKKHETLARDMAHLLSSNVGESFLVLLRELLASMKDEYVFAEDYDEKGRSQKLEIKGGIRALNTFHEMILEFAKAHIEEESPGAVPAWASSEDEPGPAYSTYDNAVEAPRAGPDSPVEGRWGWDE